MLRRRVARGLACALAVTLLLVPCTSGLASAAEPPLQALAREHLGADQGVFVRAADGTVLVDQVADRPVHPASVTKIATTLALLARLGPEHRFVTRFRAAGSRPDGRIDGDLVVEASSDPFFVYESAFLVLRRLRARGVLGVEGGLRVRGELLLNWQPDPLGRRLAAALAGEEGAAAWEASLGPMGAGVGGSAGTLAAAALRFSRSWDDEEKGESLAAGADLEQTLVSYRSPPLLHIVKVLNGFSNNVFHYAADAIGGPAAVESLSRAAVPADLRDEILLDNGAGAGTTNRLSPRAAVALLDALARELARHGRSLTDALPVSGVDPGTLADRFLEPPSLHAYVVGKTGTFGSVGASALAGALRSARHGPVTFAILNRDVPVPEARRRQDAFVRALVAATAAEPWPYDRAVKPDYAAAQVD